MRFLAALTAVLLIGCAPVQQKRPHWQPQVSGTTASLRGLCAVDSRVGWASGSSGTVLRTVDGGANWQLARVPDADQLDFRDIHAFDAHRAVVISAGLPAKIFQTRDGGRSWIERYSNTTPGVFFDALSFWNDANGIAFSDPIDGRLFLIESQDGGSTWRPIAADSIPSALPDEAGFAASGTCLAVHGQGHAWIGLGGAAARVFRTTDRGRTWAASATPLVHGQPSQGIFSVAFHDSRNGVIVGGDYRDDTAREKNAAFTIDGGQTWVECPRPPFGFRSVVAHVPGHDGRWLVAAGTSGSDYSIDGGKTWLPIGTTGFHCVSFAPDGSGWAVGAEGRVARWTLVDATTAD